MTMRLLCRAHAAEQRTKNRQHVKAGRRTIDILGCSPHACWQCKKDGSAPAREYTDDQLAAMAHWGYEEATP